MYCVCRKTPGAKAKAWCLLIHVDASLSSSLPRNPNNDHRFVIPPPVRQASSRACVGKGDKAVVELSVRRCWHLLPDDFSIDNGAAWQERVMAPLLKQVVGFTGKEETRSARVESVPGTPWYTSGGSQKTRPTTYCPKEVLRRAMRFMCAILVSTASIKCALCVVSTG
jgi:hypothetical protein